MLLLNDSKDHNTPLAAADAEVLSADAAKEVARFLSYCPEHRETPLHSLAGLANELGVGSIHVKDESFRFGMNSFKALGGAYAVIRLVLEEASRQLGRNVDITEMSAPEVRAIAKTMTVGCATDGNHGKSVAAGARLTGATSKIFVHTGVSDERVQAIADFGAEMIRIEGTYDDSVAAAERICEENGWIVVSDTSWPGYERTPALVMQGYTAMLTEILEALPELPTHVFVQAGVGGVAAAVAGHFAVVLGDKRPFFVTVEPDRAACIIETARTGKLTHVEHTEPTIMAMLECYEPSLIAWRILSRVGDAFMTIGEDDAADMMRRLAAPVDGDPAVVAGESGGAGLAGLAVACRDDAKRDALGLGPTSRVLVLNTEGATDVSRYVATVGRRPEEVLA